MPWLVDGTFLLVLIWAFLCAHILLRSLPFLIKTPILLDWGPTLMNSFNLNCQLQVLSTNTITWGAKASECDFLGGRVTITQFTREVIDELITTVLKLQGCVRESVT